MADYPVVFRVKTLKKRIRKQTKREKEYAEKIQEQARTIFSLREELFVLHLQKGHSKEDPYCSCGVYLSGNEIVGVGKG